MLTDSVREMRPAPEGSRGGVDGGLELQRPTGDGSEEEDEKWRRTRRSERA